MEHTIEFFRRAYEEGNNQFLSVSCPELSRQDIIESAYDIQSGSYTDYALDDLGRLERYASEIYALASPFLSQKSSILDCGAGELTTLSALSNFLPENCQLLACDLSLSRLRFGQRFANVMRKDLVESLRLFIADMAMLPLVDNSVDIVLATHALEPNHGNEESVERAS